jgi:hypothetical protein
MRCPNCSEEMVPGQCAQSDGGRLLAWPAEGRMDIPWYMPVLSRAPRSAIGKRAEVCYKCGLIHLFVDDPSVFRPKETQNLPSPADPLPPETDELPRPASPPTPEPDTLPRPATDDPGPRPSEDDDGAS